MFASDIGMNNIEEINIIHEGGNYGWMKRRGHLGKRHLPCPAARSTSCSRCAAGVLSGQRKDEFIYPVAMYDHNDGQAVSGGFACNGTHCRRFAAKFVVSATSSADACSCRHVSAAMKARRWYSADRGAVEEAAALRARRRRPRRTYVTFHELVRRPPMLTVTQAPTVTAILKLDATASSET